MLRTYIVLTGVAVPDIILSFMSDLYLIGADVTAVVVEGIDTSMRLALQAVALEHEMALETHFAVRAHKVLHTRATFP